MQVPSLIDQLLRETVVGAFALIALLIVLKAKPWRNGNGHHKENPSDPDVGNMPVSYWKNEIRIIMIETLIAQFIGRNEDIRKIVRLAVEDAMRIYFGSSKTDRRE